MYNIVKRMLLFIVAKYNNSYNNVYSLFETLNYIIIVHLFSYEKEVTSVVAGI